MPTVLEDEIDPFALGFQPGSRSWYEARRGGFERPARDPADVRAENLNTFANEAAYMAPIMGEALSGRDAWEASGRGAAALSEGRYKDAIGDYAGMLAATLGAVPVIGTLARGSGRVASWMDRNLSPSFNAMTTLMPADPKNQTNIFAGPGAKTADHARLAEAKAMEAAGAPPDQILQATGWGRASDGQWVFEIDDSKARIHPGALGFVDQHGSVEGSAENIFRHPELYAAYPDLAETKFAIRQPDAAPVPGRLAQFDKDRNRVDIFEPDDAASLGLHEMQHAVQRAEGRRSGTHQARAPFVADAPEVLAWNSVRPRLKQEWDDAIASGDQARIDFLKKQIRYLKSETDQAGRFEGYTRDAAEVEARNVQARQNMSEAERLQVPPWATEDVDRTRQIAGNSDNAFSEMFAGRQAKTADLEALKRAEDMQAAGASRDDIWRDTGWFQGVDGKWRYEIDDSSATLDRLGEASRRRDALSGQASTYEMASIIAHRAAREGLPIDEAAKRLEVELGRPVPVDAVALAQSQPKEALAARASALIDDEMSFKPDTQKYTLGQVVNHPELAAAYPDMFERPYNMMGIEGGIGTRGAYDKSTDEFFASKYEKPAEERSTGLHEMQHAIQGRESFSGGSSPGHFNDADFIDVDDGRILAAFMARHELPSDAIAEFKKVTGRRPSVQAIDIAMSKDPYAQPGSPREAYERTAGEVEARNVQTRRDLTPIERRASPPWQTQSVPDERQIVRNAFADDGPQMSASAPGDVKLKPVVWDDMPDGMQVYEIHANGEVQPGFINGGIDPNDPSRFIVYSIGAPGGANSLGPAATRELLRQFQELNPEIRSIGGTRLTGARQKAGVGVTDSQMSIPIGNAFAEDGPPQMSASRQWPIKPAEEDIYDVMDANFNYGHYVGDTTMPVSQLRGGASSGDRARVDDLVNQISGPDGYLRRLIVDQDGNVIEGQHRTDAFRELGITDAPVHQVKDLAADIDMERLAHEMEPLNLHPDHEHQIIRQALEMINDSGSGAAAMLEYEFPRGWEDKFKAVLTAIDQSRITR